MGYSDLSEISDKSDANESPPSEKMDIKKRPKGRFLFLVENQSI